MTWCSHLPEKLAENVLALIALVASGLSCLSSSQRKVCLAAKTTDE
jgi:hypothetical protein